MTGTRHHSPSPPAVGTTAVCGASLVLGAPALALPATLAFLVAGAPGDWIGALWLLAVLWMIGASLVQALWAGFRYGDWSAFSYCALPRDDDGHDWSTRTGRYAYLRIRGEHQTLMRDGDRYLEDHDRTDSPG